MEAKMSTQNLLELANEVKAAKEGIKALAAQARASAPTGQKMAYGQHEAATQNAKLAGQTMTVIAAQGFAPAAIAARVSKTGKVEYAVTYRQPVTLAQRIETGVNAAARRKAKREAAKAAPKTAPATNPAGVVPVANLAEVLAQLQAQRKAA
jgi:hypothetical protein